MQQNIDDMSTVNYKAALTNLGLVVATLITFTTLRNIMIIKGRGEQFCTNIIQVTSAHPITRLYIPIFFSIIGAVYIIYVLSFAVYRK
jgi:hypothetical protein